MLLLTLLACDAPPKRALPARQVPLPVRAEVSRLKADGQALRQAIGGLPPGLPAEAPDVVFIVLDTFRADRLAAYGATGGLTPALDAFASEARVFTRMRATGNWTLPTHGSLFTGLHPTEHGAHGSPAGAKSKAYGLGPSPTTLAERLGESGYRRVGVAANRAFLDSVWGLSRGFEVWQCEQLEVARGMPYVQGDRITGLAKVALAARPEGEPLLLFLNYMDTHAPWVPREGYTAHPERIEPAHLPGGKLWKRAQEGDWSEVRVEIMSGAREATQSERDTWSEAYDAEVRWLDAQVGTLLDALPSYGIDENDYVVIVSDHGEFLGEHQLLEHSKDLYEEVLRVPLMIRGPGFEPGADARPIESHEVPLLLLEAMGLEPLVPGVPGEDPLQVSEMYWSRHRELSDPALAERFGRVRRAYVSDDHKLIVSDDGAHEAYDLRADPGEGSSVYGSAAWAGALEGAGAAWLEGRTVGEGAEVVLEKEEMKRLRGLGYVE
ncbi:MAG: sulfatase [Alphaproteobacteria bacterium]|nr:sulfatase [Alphaproteobacteria bacterium]